MKNMAPRLLAAVISGSVLMFISAPANLHYLHWFIYLPLYWALRPGEHRRNALLGYVAGWFCVFLNFFWLIETVVRFSSLPWVAGLAVHLLFTTVFSLNYPLIFGLVHWTRDRLGLGWVVVIPALHVATEKLAPALFPYYQGVSQYRTGALWQLASVTGVYGLTYLVMLSNAVLAELMYRHKEGRPKPWLAPAGVVALVSLVIGFGTWRKDQVEAQLAEAPVVRVAMLQQGVTMEERLMAPALTWLASWVELTREAAPYRPDLVIWPEGAVPFNPHDERPAQALGDRSPLEYFLETSEKGKFDLLIGGGTYEPHEPDEYGRTFTSYNSAYLFNREGVLAGRYDKMVPLPFGEYIPLSDTFPFLKGIIQGPGDFQRGTEPTVFEVRNADGQTYTFSVPICYEAILEDTMADLSLADVYVNITNDAWFGDTASPHQHAMLAAVQAMHYGRPMVRIAYTGVNLVVEPHGVIRYETAPFETVVAVEELRVAPVETLFARGGWVFPWLCVFGSLVAVVIGWRRKPEQTPQVDASPET